MQLYNLFTLYRESEKVVAKSLLTEWRGQNSSLSSQIFLWCADLLSAAGSFAFSCNVLKIPTNTKNKQYRPSPYLFLAVEFAWEPPPVIMMSIEGLNTHHWAIRIYHLIKLFNRVHANGKRTTLIELSNCGEEKALTAHNNPSSSISRSFSCLLEPLLPV